jgi:hypothetical protein
LRAELRGTEVTEVQFDEDERWLWLRRGPVEIVCNFADHEQWVPCTATEVVLTTHTADAGVDGGAQADGETVLLPALGGAVLR